MIIVNNSYNNNHKTYLVYEQMFEKIGIRFDKNLTNMFCFDLHQLEPYSLSIIIHA